MTRLLLLLLLLLLLQLLRNSWFREWLWIIQNTLIHHHHHVRLCLSISTVVTLILTDKLTLSIRLLLLQTRMLRELLQLHSMHVLTLLPILIQVRHARLPSVILNIEMIIALDWMQFQWKYLRWISSVIDVIFQVVHRSAGVTISIAVVVIVEFFLVMSILSFIFVAVLVA